MKWLCFILLIIGLSCRHRLSKVKLETKELKQYYEADNVELIQKGALLEVLVTNPRFVNSKMSSTTYGKVYSIEQFTSIGALITLENLGEVNIDQTIRVALDKFPESRDYTYSIKNLKKIIEYAKTCIDFSHKLNDRNATLLLSYLSDDIIYKGITSEELILILQPLYTAGQIKDAKLIAFKIYDGIAGLYINLYYKGNIAKTFIFNFRLNRKNEIAGIEPAW